MPVDTPDGHLGVTRIWVTVPGCKRVPAGISYSSVPRKGDESFFAHQVYPTTFVNFKIRYRPKMNISDIHRVVYGKRIFNVRSAIVPEEKQTSIVLQCEEIQAKGTLH